MHQQTHMSRMHKPFKCTQCKRAFYLKHEWYLRINTFLHQTNNSRTTGLLVYMAHGSGVPKDDGGAWRHSSL